MMGALNFRTVNLKELEWGKNFKSKSSISFKVLFHVLCFFLLTSAFDKRGLNKTKNLAAKAGTFDKFGST